MQDEEDAEVVEENEDEWEDEDSEEEAEDDEDGDDDDDENEEIDHEDVHELAMKTNALLIALFSEPALNKTTPLSSPKPLLNTIDFVRRTYTEYIVPLLPSQATQKCHELSNPFTPQEPLPEDPNILDPDNFPKLDMEKFSDAVGRNMLICMAITEPEKGAMVIGGRFGFGEHVVEIAGMIAGGIEAEEQVKEKYAAQGIDLSKGQKEPKDGDVD